MTIANQISFTKRLARTTSNALTIENTDDVVRHYINMGVSEFAKEGRVSKQEFVTVTPTFWGRTNWYIQLTIEGGNNALAATNVACVESDVGPIGGATMAAHLATNINAAIGTGSIAVSWSDDTWQYTIADNTAGSITSVTVDPPSVDNYIDGTGKTLGKTGTQTGTEWESGFPEDCTLESDLPTDFLEEEYVDYDDHLLSPAPFSLFMSPESHSTYPLHYAIRGKKLYIAPVPSDRRMLKIRYRYLPTDVTLTGESDATSCALPGDSHMAPVYYAAGMILRETFEADESDRMFGLYYDLMRKYRIRENNKNPKMFPRNVDSYVPRVISDDTVS